MKGTDFPDFYCAGRILADGQGRRLYDPDLQHEYQARYVGRVGTLYIHPPFEAMLYVCLAWLPLKVAYFVWWCLNYALLALAIRRLANLTAVRWDWHTLLAVALTFVPCLLCFLQGQDSLLLLLLVVLAFAALRQGRHFRSGCWLGFGLFKFELILPLVLVLMVSQSQRSVRRLVEGFGLIAIALALSSAAISGWSVFSTYARFLLHLQEQAFVGIVPAAMANFRGLGYLVFHRDRAPAALLTETFCSALVLLIAVMGWNRARTELSRNSPPQSHTAFDLSFAGTVIACLLASYHLNPHDLSLMLIPLFILLGQLFALREVSAREKGTRDRLFNTQRWLIIALAAALFLPPLHLWGLTTGAYALLSLPMLALFLTIAFGRHKIRIDQTIA